MSDHFETDALAWIDELLCESVKGNPEREREYLRSCWISEVMFQLVVQRDQAGLTQEQVGERLGKAQSAIARLEHGSDIKLSALFDHFYACGFVPTGRIPVQGVLSACESLSKPVVKYSVNAAHAAYAADLRERLGPQWKRARSGQSAPDALAASTKKQEVPTVSTDKAA